MKVKLLSIIATWGTILPSTAMAAGGVYPGGEPDDAIKIYPEPGTVENLDCITIKTEDPSTFGAFVYMPSLYSVNEDGSLGVEVSACELVESSARGKKELQFKVQNPPMESGKYAFLIKNNSFSLISANNDEVYTKSAQAGNIKTDIQTPSASSDSSFKNFPVKLEGDTLRILHISNSYGKDLLYYVDGLLEAADVDVSHVLVERLRYTNGSFKCWNDVYKDENADTYGCYHMAGELDIDMAGTEGGKYDGSKYRMILENPWDLIILNQVSTYAPYPENWSSNEEDGGLPELLSIIREHHPEVPVGFLLIHSCAENYKGNTESWTTTQRWEKIRDGVEWLQSAYDIDFVIPYGTAIQNLRMTEYNNDHELTRDGTHLSNGLSKYTAGCCYFETVFSPRYKKSVWGNSLRVTDKEVEKDYEIEVDDAAAETAQKAAILARHTMYEVRNPYKANLTDYRYGEPLNSEDYRVEYNLGFPEAADEISNEPQDKPYRIYGPTGLRVSKAMSEEEWAKLPRGLYIVNGAKIYKSK